MQLRPFAPLAVIGAGLVAMTIATYSASADDGGAPADVVVSATGSGLVVSWDAPDGTAAPDGYDLTVTDAAGGKQVLDRRVGGDVTAATVARADLAGFADLTVSVAAEYGTRSAAGQPVRVTVTPGPSKPDAAPAVRAEGRLLQVVLPAASTGSTSRIVRLLRDGAAWATVPVGDDPAVVTRRVPAGHAYAASYQDVDATGAGPFSDASAAVTVRAVAGPGAVRTIKLAVVDDGLRVRWSAATSTSAIASYRITVLRDGERVGSALTKGDLRRVVVPGTAADGSYTVTVVATDAAGATSTSTAAVAVAR